MIDTREQRLRRAPAARGCAAGRRRARAHCSARARSSRGASTPSRPQGDVAALGSPEEREQWARIQQLEAALAERAGRRGDRRAARPAAAREGRAVFPPERVVQGAHVAQRRTHQGPRSRACTRRRPAGCAWSRRARACRRTPASSPRASRRCRQRIDALQLRLVDAAQKQNDLSRGARRRGARGAEGPPRDLPGPGALRAGHDVRPRGECRQPHRRRQRRSRARTSRADGSPRRSPSAPPSRRP